MRNFSEARQTTKDSLKQKTNLEANKQEAGLKPDAQKEKRRLQ